MSSQQPGPGGAVPPSGAPPGFPSIDPTLLPHDDKGGEVQATVWILTAFAAVFLGLRLYCRMLKSRRLLWEDWVLIASFACLLFQSIMVSVQVGLGYGRHAWDVPPQNVDSLALYGLIIVTVVIVGQVWSKTSFAMTLLRIAGERTKWFLWFVIVSINIFMGIGALFFWVQCTPLDKAWKPLMQGGKCWDPQININYGIFASVYSGTADLVLAVLPWRIVLGLQLKLQEKIGVALAMSMGAFAGVAAYFKASHLSSLASPDFAYEGRPLVVWGAAETAVTIMAASIPVLRVLVRDIATSRGYFRSGEPKADGSTGISAANKSGSGGSRAAGDLSFSQKTPTHSAPQDDASADGSGLGYLHRPGNPRHTDDEEAAFYEMTWQGGGTRKVTVRSG